MESIKKVMRNNERGYTVDIYGFRKYVHSQMQEDIDTLLTYFQNNKFESGQIYEHKNGCEHIELIFIYRGEIIFDAYNKDTPKERTLISPIEIEDFERLLGRKEYTLIEDF